MFGDQEYLQAFNEVYGSVKKYMRKGLVTSIISVHSVSIEDFLKRHANCCVFTIKRKCGLSSCYIKYKDTLCF